MGNSVPADRVPAESRLSGPALPIALGYATWVHACPFVGWLSDRVRYKRLDFVVRLALTLAIAPAVAFLDAGTLAQVFAFGSRGSRRQQRFP